MSELNSVERYDPEKYQPQVDLNPEYLHNPDQMKEQVGLSPDTRIRLLSNDGVTSTHLLDSAIRIRSVAQTYCQPHIASWEHMQKEHVRVRNGVALSSGLCGLLALSPSFIQGLSLIFCAAFAMFATYRHQKAKEAAAQIQLWNTSPVLEAAEKRKQAYKQGFPYLYAHNLKWQDRASGVLHPLEVKNFYEQYFAQFYDTMLSREANTSLEQLQWLGDFCKLNPLTPSLMRYGLGEIPEHLQTISKECEQLILEKLSGKLPPRDQIAPLYARAREILLKAEQAWKSHVPV